MDPVSDTESLSLEGMLYIRVTLNKNPSILIAFNATGPEYLLGMRVASKTEHYWSFHLYTEGFVVVVLVFSFLRKGFSV